MPCKPICFVTGNANKVQEFTSIFKDCIPFTVCDLHVPELQGTPEEVAMAKARSARDQYGGPVIIEDVSLGFNAYAGLPGVYIKHFLKSLGHDGLNRMLATYDDKSAYALCIYAYCDQDRFQDPVLFVGRCDGSIVPARGPCNFGWDPIFEPNLPGGKTFSELDGATKNSISHRGKAVALLKDWIGQNYAREE